MSPHHYRVVLQLDRARCLDGEDRPDFADSAEVRMDEIELAIEDRDEDAADDRASAVFDEIAAAIPQILKRHVAERSVPAPKMDA